MEPCRKCGTPNPVANQYCRKCGATLDVSTVEVKAQRRPVLPSLSGIRWRWVGLGALVTLGIVSTMLGGLAVIARFAISVGPGSVCVDLASLADRFIGLAIAAVATFLLAFGLGGMFTGWVARRRAAAEAVLASIAVLILTGSAGMLLTEDAPIVAAVLALPSAVLAALGGRLGGLLGRRATQQ